MNYMVELNHDLVNVSTSDVIVKGNHGVVVGVKVIKSGNSGSKVLLRNGTTDSDPIEFTVYGEDVQDLGNLNRRFEAGIFADVTGTAEYLIIFK